MVSGLSALPDDAECGVETFGPILDAGTPGASNRTVT